MSLTIMPIPAVPDETARITQAAFPHGTLLIQIRDALGTLYTDEDFADLFPSHGQPADAPWRLALVSVLQFVEGLTDRQAADAVRSRLDWKYALSLELTDPGFDHTVLSEFRTRLLQEGQSSVCWMWSWRKLKSMAGSRNRAGSGPIRPMYWLPAGCWGGWQRWERRCGMRSMCCMSGWLRHSGCPRRIWSMPANGLAAALSRFQVEVIGPTRGNFRWQARDQQGFDGHQFQVDWEAHRAICPQGHTSVHWRPSYDRRPGREYAMITGSTSPPPAAARVPFAPAVPEPPHGRSPCICPRKNARCERRGTANRRRSSPRAMPRE